MSVESVRALDGVLILYTTCEAATLRELTGCATEDEITWRRYLRERQFRNRFAFRVRAIRCLIDLGLE